MLGVICFDKIKRVIPKVRLVKMFYFVVVVFVTPTVCRAADGRTYKQERT
jgi:hypothetical protein